MTRHVDPGSLAEVVAEANRAFIIHVASREVEKKEDTATRIDTQLASASRQNEMAAFVGWLTDRVEAAKVEQLNRR